jgi:hypothetical protein
MFLYLSFFAHLFSQHEEMSPLARRFLYNDFERSICLPKGWIPSKLWWSNLQNAEWKCKNLISTINETKSLCFFMTSPWLHLLLRCPWKGERANSWVEPRFNPFLCMCPQSLPLAQLPATNYFHKLHILLFVTLDNTHTQRLRRGIF